jgi:hypothetical protein
MVLMRFIFAMLVIVAVGCSKSSSPTAPSPTELLAQQVEQERQSSDAFIEGYTPRVKGQIDELAASAADILRQLPGVADVEVLVRTPKASHRIIHLRDWHFVPRDMFALDVRQQVFRPVTDEEIDRLYQKFLLEVELVQIEQETILRSLAKHHGLRQVLVEGLTPRSVAAYREILEALRDMNESLSGLKKARAELRSDAPTIDERIKEMELGQRKLLLEYGSAVKLEMEGKLKLQPLDDGELLEQAKPVAKDGKLKVENAKRQARHDAQVKAALASGPCSFIVLGGKHDLSESVRRLGGGVTEYVRVTTRRYREVAGEK